jgi:cobaltochelatase CobN
MKRKGISPVEARKFSTVRVFGGVNGHYGTGIMGLVEQGDKWEKEEEIAAQYIKNMGAMYSDGNWSE